MFEYNRFWHFWYTLNNRHYSRAFLSAVFLSLCLIAPAIFFPFLWPLLAAPFVLIALPIFIFTKVSNLIYNRQQKKLTTLKAATSDEVLKNEIDLYLDRRVVLPKGLVEGQHLQLENASLTKKKPQISAPLILESDEALTFSQQPSAINRNQGYIVNNSSENMYVKEVNAEDGLSEIAAREMAEILGFHGVIPANTLSRHDVGDPNFLLSRAKIAEFIKSE